MSPTNLVFLGTIALLLTFWVYQDAQNNQRNRWLWGAGVLINTPVFFPLYFWTRPPEFYWSCPDCHRVNRTWSRQCPQCETVIPSVGMQSRLYGFWTEADAISVYLLSQAAISVLALVLGVRLAPEGDEAVNVSRLWLLQMITVNVMLLLSFYCLTGRYRRSVRDIGLRAANWHVWLPLGLAIGVVLIILQNAINAVLMELSQAINFDLAGQLEQEMGTQRLGWPTSLEDPLLLVVVFVAGILVPFAEEVLVRGLGYRAARARFGPKTAIVLTSLVFAFMHQSPGFFLSLFVIGLVLNLVYERTQSLLPPIFAHMSLNITAILIGVGLPQGT